MKRFVRSLWNKPATLPFLILFPFTLPYLWPALDLYFSTDDLTNLYYYLQRPAETLYSNLLFFTSFRRPLGGALYLSLYCAAGMQPFWYYLTGILIFSVNVFLILCLMIRLLGNRKTALAAIALVTLHPVNNSVWYNFGAVYELLSMSFIMATILLYIRSRGPIGPEGLTPPNRWDYFHGWALVTLVLALDAKEMAVTVPALLLLYELVYHRPALFNRRSFRDRLVRLAPFFLIVLVFTLGKSLGTEAMWRDNPAYRYEFDSTIFHNLHAYLDQLFLNLVHFNDKTLLWTLIATLGLALLLKNRPMLFGWGFFLITLFPVLPLPRVWSLFLYIPLVGAATYVAELASVILRTTGHWTGDRFPDWRLHPAARWAILAVLVAALFWAGRDSVKTAYLNNYFLSRDEWRTFGSELFERYPRMDPETCLLFENAPPPQWNLHFMIWLTYKSDRIKVFRYPEQEAQFQAAARTQPSHVFRYRDGMLSEVNMKQLRNAGP